MDSEHVTEQAAYWLHRLNEDDSPECQAEFDRWLRAAAVHTEEFLLAKAVWMELGRLDPVRTPRTDSASASSNSIVEFKRAYGEEIRTDAPSSREATSQPNSSATAQVRMPGFRSPLRGRLSVGVSLVILVGGGLLFAY